MKTELTAMSVFLRVSNSCTLHAQASRQDTFSQDASADFPHVKDVWGPLFSVSEQIAKKIEREETNLGMPAQLLLLNSP